MTDPKLVEQIAAEAKELAEVPKIPLAQFMGGPVQRCQMCGKLVPINDLEPIDQHVIEKGGRTRLGCRECRRNG